MTPAETQIAVLKILEHRGVLFWPFIESMLKEQYPDVDADLANWELDAMELHHLIEQVPAYQITGAGRKAIEDKS